MAKSYDFDLGHYSRPVQTDFAAAQTWFDRGLIWAYAFNHEEAADCFEKALEIDPSCAMAAWGIAYSLGPNYNKTWDDFEPDELTNSVRRAHEAAILATRLAPQDSGVERALVEAIPYRYPQDTPATDCSVWNADFASAMRDVYQQFPNDLDVGTLYADSLMNLTPWELWDQRTGKPAEGAATLEILDVLERALKLPGGDEHPGVLHMYIHAMEMSAHPEDALLVADRIRDLVPDAGHLQHMPTHLDVLCGDYNSVITSNTAAIRADEKFVEHAGRMKFYTLYRCHDYHFKIYGAMFLGQRATALETCDQLEQAIPEDLLRVPSPPMADWLEGFVAMRMHVLIRFGAWQEILELALPHDSELYAKTTAMMRYARTIAYATLGEIEQATAERELFYAAKDVVPESRFIFNNTCRDILEVAAAMLEGELEYRKGNFENAFSALRNSVYLDDNLPYDEPWGWMQPTRHAYGALLMEQGHIEDAEAVYRADLGLDDTVPRSQQHPMNVWALHGYHECLEKLGKTGEAAIVEQQLKFSKARSDVPVEASCFCRLSAFDQQCGCVDHDDGCSCEAHNLSSASRLA